MSASGHPNVSDEISRDDEISLLDIAVVIAESWIVLIVVPAVVAALAFLALNLFESPQFRSQAILRIDEGEAAFITSARVLNPAIVDSDWVQREPGSLSGARDRLVESLSITPIEGTGTYNIALTTDDPELSRTMLDAIVASLIENSAPSDVDRQRLELRLDVLRRSLANFQSSLERLNQLYDQLNSGTSPTMATIELGNLGGSIVSLVTQIATTEQDILSTELALQGSVSVSDIFQAPTTPDNDENRSAILKAALAGLATGFLLLIAVFIRAGLRTAAQNPSAAEKVERIRKAFWLPARETAG